MSLYNSKLFLNNAIFYSLNYWSSHMSIVEKNKSTRCIFTTVHIYTRVFSRLLRFEATKERPFPIYLRPNFDLSLGAHPFICKSIFMHMQIQLILMWMKIDFAHENMSTKTRFEKEAWGNSEMAYCISIFFLWYKLWISLQSSIAEKDCNCYI